LVKLSFLKISFETSFLARVLKASDEGNGVFDKRGGENENACCRSFRCVKKSENKELRNVSEEFIYLLKKFPLWLNGRIKEYREWYNNKRDHRGIKAIPITLYTV